MGRGGRALRGCVRVPRCRCAGMRVRARSRCQALPAGVGEDGSGGRSHYSRQVSGPPWAGQTDYHMYAQLSLSETPSAVLGRKTSILPFCVTDRPWH